MAEQLEFPFEEPPAAPRRPAAPPARSGNTDAAARPSRSRQAVPGEVAAAIPARCPVVRRSVCYYGDCHYFQQGGCAHPEAVTRRRRRR